MSTSDTIPNDSSVLLDDSSLPVRGRVIMEIADLPYSPILNRCSPHASREIVVPQDTFTDISDGD